MIKATAAQRVNEIPETAAQNTTDTITTLKQRISSIDIIRGLVMLIMALDHVRDYFHISLSDPTNLSTTTIFIFFTRWITHFCAPTFVLLSGVSAYLAGLQKSKPALSAYLITRGIWLIILDIAVITFAIRLDPLYHFIMLQVIFATGMSMIILGLLVWTPLPVIGIFGAIIFFGRNLFDGLTLSTGTFGSNIVRSFAGSPFIWHLNSNHAAAIMYNILPWTSLMLLGYVLGPVYTKSYEQAKRKRVLIGMGIFLLFLFLLLRGINGYGDPSAWSKQSNFIFTLLSFLNTTKYPCSLDFLCMTLGPMLILLAYAENVHNWFTEILKVYGNVPLFYYILHFYLARLISVIVFAATGSSFHDLFSHVHSTYHPTAIRFHLGGVYLIWLLIVLSLYFPCKWYGKYKRTHRYWWLTYL